MANGGFGLKNIICYVAGQLTDEVKESIICEVGKLILDICLTRHWPVTSASKLTKLGPANDMQCLGSCHGVAEGCSMLGLSGIKHEVQVG